MSKTISRSEQDTIKVAESLAAELLNKPWPYFITLTGNLGAGNSIIHRVRVGGFSQWPADFSLCGSDRPLRNAPKNPSASALGYANFHGRERRLVLSGWHYGVDSHQSVPSLDE